MPNLPSADQVGQFITLIKGYSLEYVQEIIFDSGIVSDLLKIQYVDRSRFRRFCTGIPENEEEFTMYKDVRRRYKLILCPNLSGQTITEVKDYLSSFGTIPREYAIDLFNKNHSKSDGDEPIALASPIDGKIPIIHGKFGENWEKFYVGLDLETGRIPIGNRIFRWLVEVVDQPSETPKWERVALRKQAYFFVRDPKMVGIRLELLRAGCVGPCSAKIGRIEKAFLDGEEKNVVQCLIGEIKGYFVIDEKNEPYWGKVLTFPE